MTHQLKHSFLFAAILIMALTACVKAPPGPTAPTPPQITLSAVVNQLATDLDAAGVGMKAARDQNQMSQADFNAGMQISVVIATAGKAINVELRSTDTWEVQKVKILNIVTGSGLRAAYPRLPPTAAAILAASAAVVNQIIASVGGTFQL